MPHTLYLNFIFYILYLILGSSCHYPRPDLEDGKLGAKTRDSLTYLYERHYTWNTNLEVQEDSVTIACLPVKDCYNTLYKGDRVVVAEFAIHPTDSVDSVWVKLAHSQEVQGWLREKDMIRAFVLRTVSRRPFTCSAIRMLPISSLFLRCLWRHGCFARSGGSSCKWFTSMI